MGIGRAVAGHIDDPCGVGQRDLVAVYVPVPLRGELNRFIRIDIVGQRQGSDLWILLRGGQMDVSSAAAISGGRGGGS